MMSFLPEDGKTTAAVFLARGAAAADFAAFALVAGLLVRLGEGDFVLVATLRLLLNARHRLAPRQKAGNHTSKVVRTQGTTRVLRRICLTAPQAHLVKKTLWH